MSDFSCSSDSCFITLLCPKCGLPLEKIRYATKANWETSWRIRCTNKCCEVDTGRQCHMSAAYEALAVLYFGAQANERYQSHKSRCRSSVSVPASSDDQLSFGF